VGNLVSHPKVRTSRVFENRVLMKIFGSKMEEVAGGKEKSVY
jgi:hypothetical protein